MYNIYTNIYFFLLIIENITAMPHLKIRQWPLEGFINYICQADVTHSPHTPHTLYPLPNIYLRACRGKLRGLSACRLCWIPGGLLVAVQQWSVTIGETKFPCYVFSFAEIPRWQGSPYSWQTSLQFSVEKSRRDYKKAYLKTYCITICYYYCSTSRRPQKNVSIVRHTAI